MAWNADVLNENKRKTASCLAGNGILCKNSYLIIQFSCMLSSLIWEAWKICRKVEINIFFTSWNENSLVWFVDYKDCCTSDAASASVKYSPAYIPTKMKPFTYVLMYISRFYFDEFRKVLLIYNLVFYQRCLFTYNEWH